MKNKVNVILTFDNKEQEIFDLPLRERDIPKGVLDDEATLLFYILMHGKHRLQNEGYGYQDLVKISMCFHITDKLAKTYAVKKSIDRGAKYYFQPNQRDKVENKLIEFDKTIASETRPYDVEQIKSFANLN